MIIKNRSKSLYFIMNFSIVIDKLNKKPLAYAIRIQHTAIKFGETPSPIREG
jgi:hypothetical protein